MSVRIDDHSDEVKAEIEAALLKGLEECGITAETYAKLKSPVDTGRLKNSISHTVDGDTAYIGTNVEYAAYQELGTSKMPAHPYLRPAVENHVDVYKKLLTDELKKIK